MKNSRSRPTFANELVACSEVEFSPGDRRDRCEALFFRQAGEEGNAGEQLSLGVPTESQSHARSLRPYACGCPGFLRRFAQGDQPEMIAPMPAGRSSVRYVLGTLTGNPQLRRVELAFVTFNCGEYAGWVAMLVYAYAQGGVTESGIVATVMLIPGRRSLPSWPAWTRFAPGRSSRLCRAGVVLRPLRWPCSLSSKLVVYALLAGPRSRSR